MRDTTATDAIEKLQEVMDILHNDTVFAAKIRTRFDKEFLMQAALTELGSQIASYDMGHLETGQWPPYATIALNRGTLPYLGEMDTGAAVHAAFRGRGVVGAARNPRILPP